MAMAFEVSVFYRDPAHALVDTNSVGTAGAFAFWGV
jgi:hypothetical protein